MRVCGVIAVFLWVLPLHAGADHIGRSVIPNISGYMR
jgi:hypothetical protein